MNVKTLSITVLVFTILIFWGNYYVTQSDARTAGKCTDCECTIAINGVPPGALKPFNIKDYQYPNLEVFAWINHNHHLNPWNNDPITAPPDITYPPHVIKEMEAQREANWKRANEEFRKESCSVIFKNQAGKQVIENLGAASIKRFSCGVAVFCGRPRKAAVLCGRNYFDVNSNTKCSMGCMPGGKTWSSCEFWKRSDPTQSKPEKKGLPGGSMTSALSPMFFAPTFSSNSFSSAFLPVKYTREPADEDLANEVIAPLARWQLLDGEGGFDDGLFTLVTGQAEVQSFCTGDTVRLAGPSVITLPSCPVDINGHWQGAYTRRLPLETGPPVTISIGLRTESYALKGEVKTADGTFNIVSARQNGTNLQLEADGNGGDGQARKIILNGKITKGDIVFDGTESGIGAKPLKLLGAVRRMYIADNAVPSAVINQPYNFPLTRVSPDAEAITFRLATGRLPRGVFFDDQSGTLRGTPAELGTFNIRVAAADPLGNVFEQSFTLIVKKMSITTALMPDAFNGQPYSGRLKVVGGQAPYRFSGTPPKGLTLDPNTGVISGIPTSSTHEASYFTVRDAQNSSETQAVSLPVRRTTILTSNFLPEATQGSAYRMQFQAVGNNLPTTWKINEGSGDDISFFGLALNRETGELSGIPRRFGVLRFSVLANTTSSDQQSRTFTLLIKPSR